jgi:hypothetical protein
LAGVDQVQVVVFRNARRFDGVSLGVSSVVDPPWRTLRSSAVSGGGLKVKKEKRVQHTHNRSRLG